MKKLNINFKMGIEKLISVMYNRGRLFEKDKLRLLFIDLRGHILL